MNLRRAIQRLTLTIAWYAVKYNLRRWRIWKCWRCGGTGYHSFGHGLRTRSTWRAIPLARRSEAQGHQGWCECTCKYGQETLCPWAEQITVRWEGPLDL